MKEMKNKSRIICGVLLMAAMIVSSCEKMVVEEEEAPVSPKAGKGKVTLRVAGFNIVPFDTRAVVDLTTYCTRLNYVVYKDGNKVASKSQLKEDGNFGEVTMSLEPGTYKLLVLAHSSKGGNPALSDPENIQFTNSLTFSDTFYYYGDLEVTSEDKTHDISMMRATSLLRFIIEDNIPSDVKYLHFKYTGGTGVLNAVTGYGGNVNSQQEMWYAASGDTPLTLSLYTFLKGDEGSLQVTVQAMASDMKTVIAEKTFTNVPMKRNMVTEYRGSFFTVSSSNSFSLTAETEWEIYQSFTY